MNTISNFFLFATILLCSQQSALSQEQTTFEKTDAKSLTENVFSAFDNNWFVVTAGNGDTYNPMTISWGGFGILWGAPVATIYIRDTRYTYQLLNEGKYFTLCAFDEKYRSATQYIGTKSGRDEDKIKASGLTPLKTELGNTYYAEARLVIECEKVYNADFQPENITDPKGANMYKDTESVHRIFIGKILNVWKKKL
ncbi:MAG: flavin reductase [Prevotellaceae bacterium]|nr:flavin reductase [Prevotellaceae bacterium]